MTPKRIQRRRTKGWRLPSNTVVVTRPSVFGNPFTVEGCRAAGYAGYVGSDDAIAERCVEAFRVWLGPNWRENWDGDESEQRRAALFAKLPTLRGKDLACWCAEDSKHCHASVLLAIANE